jgi:hypothetical protein
MSGQAVQYLPTSGVEAEKSFSCFLGSMLLSFCSIESFAASVAFSMPSNARFESFDFNKYRRTRPFWNKMDQLFGQVEYKIDRSLGIFQKIAAMQNWRNLVTHSSPYRIDETPVKNTSSDSMKLHLPFHDKEYTRKVNIDGAREFYLTSLEFIDLLKGLTGIEPHAHATHTIGTDE